MRQPKFRPFLLTFGAGLSLFLALDILGGTPRGVDQPVSAGQWAALPVLFALWLACLAAWGRVALGVAGLAAPAPGLSLAVGSLAAALLAYLLGMAGLLLPGMRFFLYIVLALGPGLAPWKRPALKRQELFAALPLLLLFTLFAFDALYPHPYWDPLHHHLVGARQFWEAGHIHFPPYSAASYQEGGFELLFLWPHFFLAGAGGLGLLPVQIFGQLTHAVLGFGGSLMLAHSLVARWLPHPAWRSFALLLFAAPASLHFAVPTAKNDWGLVLWVLAGFFLLGIPEDKTTAARRSMRFCLAGLLWGFAFLAKLSSVFALAGLSTVLVFRRPPKKQALAFVAGVAAGMLPLALRNWLGGGNPLFPLLSAWFPGTRLGPTWLEALSVYQAAPAPFARVRELISEFPLAPLGLLIPALAIVRKNAPELRAAAAAVLVGFSFFALAAGQATELRLLGTLLPTAGLLTGVLVFQIVSRLPFRFAALPWILLALLALSLPYRWQALSRLKILPRAHELSRTYVSGEAQGWFRDHYRYGMRAALLVESRIYHSLPLPVVRIWDAPDLDRKLRAAGRPEEFLETLRQEGFTHLILSQEKLDLFYPRQLVADVERYVLAREKSFVFQSPFSIVADLNLLR